MDLYRPFRVLRINWSNCFDLVGHWWPFIVATAVYYRSGQYLHQERGDGGVAPHRDKGGRVP